MALDLYTLAEKLADDASIELNGEKYTGAELKAWAGSQRQTLTERETAIAAERAEKAALAKRFEQFEGSTSALLRAAAAEAARDDGAGNGNRNGGGADVDPEWAPYETDPLFSPFAKAYSKRVLGELDSNYFKPWVEKQLNPVVDELRRSNQALTTMLIDERQHREYRDLGDWPDKFDLGKARQVGAEKGYYVSGTTRQDPSTGRVVGVVDLNRVHGEVMGPILQTKRDADKEAEITERVTRELRMNANVIAMPNRSMSGAPPVKAKGHTAEEIFGNALNDAAADAETQRALVGLRG
jgi:hypothetical protein